MVDYAERGRAAEKRHAAAKHRQRGRGKRDEALEQGRAVESAHSQAKHKARWRMRERDRSTRDDDEIARWRKTYFRNVRPDLDPQSAPSKVLEFLGLDDDPYARDARSFDYRNEAWNESVKRGSPDMSWFLPEISDEAAAGIVENVRGIAGGNETTAIGRDRARAMLAELGQEPTEEQIDQLLLAASDDEIARANLTDYLGREPSDDEWAEWKRLTTDPRDTYEKNAGAVMNLLSFPLFSFEDEALAGAMSMLPGRGTYDEELAKAREIQKRYEQYEDAWGPRNVASTAASLAAGFAGPVAATWGATSAGVRGARAAMGLAPEATSLSGKAVQAVASGAPAGAADFALMDYGAGEGGAQKRFENIDPAMVTAGAVSGGLVFPLYGAIGSGIVKGGKKAVGAGSKLVKNMMRGRQTRAAATGIDTPPSWPGRMPDRLPAGIDDLRVKTNAAGSVRSDINRAFARHGATRADDAALAAALVPAGAVGGGAIYASQRNKKRKK